MYVNTVLQLTFLSKCSGSTREQEELPLQLRARLLEAQKKWLV